MLKNPVYVDWAITQVCNLKCRHCVGMEQGELDHEQALKTARDIISLKPRWVILEGGEPLLRKDLPEIGGMLRGAGIQVFVITNGNAFNEANLQQIAAFSPRILFSFDGANREDYEYVKRGASFEKATRWAGRCAELGLFEGITTVLTRRTMPAAKDFIRLTESLGGKTIIFLPLKPYHGDAEADVYYHENALTPADHKQAVADIYSMDSPLEIFYDEPFLWNLAAKSGLSLSRASGGITIPEIKGCAAAHSLYIQTDGSVRPCMFCPASLTFGNCGKESLPEIWERMATSEILTGWMDQKARSGRCRECKDFETCRGCLARTAILSTNPLDGDVCCPFGG